MRTSASTPTVTRNDHVAAAAYLMKHASATALVVLDGQWPARPVGIITKADIARAVAAGEDHEVAHLIRMAAEAVLATS